jgi:hypothetical protein
MQIIFQTFTGKSITLEVKTSLITENVNVKIQDEKYPMNNCTITAPSPWDFCEVRANAS